MLFPKVKAGSSKAAIAESVSILTNKVVNNAKAGLSALEYAHALYDSLGLGKMGLAKEALDYAFKGHQKLVEEGLLSNPDILTICDFTQSSLSKRMYILDVKNRKVLLNTYVAHGRNSGLDYAERFSNAPESLESSLGFYVTKNTYSGKHGTSLKLSGLEEGFNNNAESRAVVVHGAPYIGEQRASSAYMGRSFGCPAVPQVLAPKVIDLIKNGTCLFIYHPDQKYLTGSPILNS